jgi:hypothetical protein
MAIKLHMSTVTGKWEQCKADAGKCHYADDSKHIMVASVRELDVFNRITAAQADLGNVPIIADTIFRIYKGDSLDDQDVNKIDTAVEQLYERHYRLQPFIIEASVTQPESNIRYMYRNGNGSYSIKGDSYWVVDGLGADFVGNEKQEYSLLEATAQRDNRDLVQNGIAVGMINGKPCYNLSTTKDALSSGKPGYQMIPENVIEFYGIKPDTMHGHKYVINGDRNAFSAYDVLASKYADGADFRARNDFGHSSPYEMAVFYDSVTRVPDEPGADYRQYRIWHFDKDMLTKVDLFDDDDTIRFFRESGLVPDINDADMKIEVDRDLVGTFSIEPSK